MQKFYNTSTFYRSICCCFIFKRDITALTVSKVQTYPFLAGVIFQTSPWPVLLLMMTYTCPSLVIVSPSNLIFTHQMTHQSVILLYGTINTPPPFFGFYNEILTDPIYGKLAYKIFSIFYNLFTGSIHVINKVNQ